MAVKCRQANCDAFARKLTGIEIRNLLGFNITHDVCKNIFLGTVKGLCPYHAAKALPEDLRPENSIIDALSRQWNHLYNDNFSDSKRYALCSRCSTLLLSDKGDHPVSFIGDILAALYVPSARIETIVWLQNKASGGLGMCFDCSLVTHTDFECDDDGNFLETELDRMCQADLD